MKELVEKVAELYAAFEKDAKAQIENGNKAAGTRARKASLEIEKSMKAFRKASFSNAAYNSATFSTNSFIILFLLILLR